MNRQNKIESIETWDVHVRREVLTDEGIPFCFNNSPLPATNYIQSPLYIRAETAYNVLKSGSTGKICAITKIFSGAGESQNNIMNINDSNPFYLFFLWLLV